MEKILSATQEKDCESLLEQRHIKPTSIRVLILRELLHENDVAVSMPELEAALVTVDKSTIFRTITLFLAHHLIHCVDDGTGALKYAVCDADCNCDVDDLHSHFYCEECHLTFCLKHTHVPIVKLPDGFKVHTVNYVLKGLCPSCAEKHRKREL